MLDMQLMPRVCYFCGTVRSEEYPDSCLDCDRSAYETPSTDRLAERVGCAMYILEWDGEISLLVLTAADAERNLAVVTYEDGQTQRMSLTALADAVL